ncbi:MAG TPA: bifunctional riboflavin kinase/FAD synthetase [Anaerolineaceae bacterium]|jgi:riboflavin kinase/FMN adenylyltransferase
MRHFQSLDEVNLSNSWLTIGSFDGVHRGHQQILKDMVQGAHNAGSMAAVLTFFPHPAAVLRGLNGPFYLTNPDEKAALVAERGADLLITLPFTRELANRSAQDFMADLERRLGLRQLWVGYNFTLGRNREGDVAMLTRLGEVLGYHLEVVQPITIDGDVVSSSMIRGLVAKGDVSRAGTLLGRPFSVPGEIVPGDGRGRTIGIPTANLDTWPERLLPATGVYACWAWLGTTRHAAVTNIGVRPTFTPGETVQHVEAHLLDVHQDMYGRMMRLEFIERLRGEQRFSSVDALLDQIQADIRQAKGILTP